jgi:hypothetical protein
MTEKEAYELYKKKLLKDINSKITKVIKFSPNKPSKENLILENETLKEIIDKFFSYTLITEAQNNKPSPAGRKKDKNNEIVMHMALEDCIKKLNGVYPTFKQFQIHWNNPKLYKVNETKTYDSINGIGYEKLKKFVENNFDVNSRKKRLIELKILDCMAEQKYKLSSFLKIK